MWILSSWALWLVGLEQLLWGVPIWYSETVGKDTWDPDQGEVRTLGYTM